MTKKEKKQLGYVLLGLAAFTLLKSRRNNQTSYPPPQGNPPYHPNQGNYPPQYNSPPPGTGFANVFGAITSGFGTIYSALNP